MDDKKTTDEVVDEVFQQCKKEGILTSFLQTHEDDVRAILKEQIEQNLPTQ